MIRVYSPEEVLKMCEPCFGGWDLKYKTENISGVYLNENQACVTKEMAIKTLDKINKFFPLHWCDVDILCLPFRPMLKDKKGSWAGEDYNGQAWKGIIALGAQSKANTELSASTMLIHELFHELAYRFVDSTPFDGKDTPEYIKFKQIMGIQDYKDSDFLWEDRPAEILAELGRYYAEDSDFTWEEFITFNDKYDPEPKREAYDYLMSLIPPKTNNGDFIENRNSNEVDNMSKKIGTDKGHGGKDPGSIGFNGLLEKDVTLNIGLKLDELLINNGFTVITTRVEDKFMELADRTKLLNNAKCDMAVSIHVNSSTNKSANYIATYIQGKGGQAEILANHVQKQLVATTKFPDGGVRVENFHMTRETTMPAVLVELGFISNPEQEKWLREKSNQDKLAVAICKGICDYYKIEYKEENKLGGYVGYKISGEVPIILDGQEINLKAQKIETPQGGVTFLPIRDFLEKIVRDKFGIDLEVGWDGRVLLNNKKKVK